MVMAWKTLGAVSRAEIRLLLRRPGFWVYSALLALLAVLVVTLEVNSGAANTLDIVVLLIGNLSSFQVLAMAWLVTSVAVRHVPSSRDWYWATPVETPVKIWGQIGALFTGLIISLIGALACASATMMIHGAFTVANMVALWTIALAILVPITFFELSVIFSLGLALRHMLLTIGVVVILFTLQLVGVLMPYSTLFSPFNYSLATLRLDPLARIGPEHPLLSSLLWLYVSIALTVLMLALWFVSKTEVRSTWQPRSTHWLNVLLCIGLVSSSGAVYSHRNAVQRSIVPPPVVDQIEAWRVVAAEHIGSIDRDRLEISARLNLTNQSSATLTSTVLALNPGLQVNWAELNGESIAAHREGETVRLIHADLPIAPQQHATLTLAYQGVHRVLREDYARANGRSQEEPTAFARQVRAYIDDNVIMLQRDGDWRIWPVSAAPYYALQNQVRLSLPSERKIISSATIVQSQNGQTTYTWSGHLPQLLLVSAAYKTIQTEFGRVYMAELGHSRDLEQAVIVLQFRRALADLLQESPNDDYTAVVLPYTQDVATGGTLVGIPATARVPFSRLQAATFTSGGAQRILLWTQGVFAQRLAYDLLTERIAWPSLALNTRGQPRSYTTECTFDVSGKANCTTRIRGENTPQAPQGRLTEPVTISPLLYAWSIVLGRHIARNQLDTKTLDEERDMWAALSEPVNQANLATRDSIKSTLFERGLLPDLRPDEEEYVRTVARFVTQIQRLHEKIGDSGLAMLLNDIAATHPAGGEPLNEATFQRLVMSVSKK